MNKFWQQELYRFYIAHDENGFIGKLLKEWLKKI